MIKIIAMLTMLIDHAGVLLFPQLRILRTIGRIAFPIFAYQVAIGYSKTSSKKNYAKRLLIFGIISQIPYTFLNRDMDFYPYHLNVILLFLYAIGILFLFDKVKDSIKKLSINFNFMNLSLGLGYLVLMIVGIFLPEILEVNFSSFWFSYSYYGILMIFIFYVFKERWLLIISSYLVLSFAYAYIGYAEHFANVLREPVTQSLLRFDLIWENIIDERNGLYELERLFFQARSLMALPIIMILERFYVNIKLNRYIAYIFYPAHLALLICIRLILGGPIIFTNM